MKRSLHVLALMFLTTSLALVGCGDSENKGDGGTPSSDGPATLDAGHMDSGAVDGVTPVEVGKPDVPITNDTRTVDVNTPLDAPVIDAPAVDGPAARDTGAVEVDRAIDSGRRDTGTGRG